MKKMLMILMMTMLLLPVLPARASTVQLHVPPRNLLPSTACRVLVEGVELKVVDATVNHQRTWAANPILTGSVPFGIFDMSGPVTVEVLLPEKAESALVRPLSLGIHPHVSGNSIRFVLQTPGPVTVEWDGDYKNALHLFAQPVESDVPDREDPDVLYFGPGLHDVGVLEPDSGQTVYLAGGSVLLGAIQAEGKQDITVRGRGILSGKGYDRWKDSIVPLNFNNCDNITIEGITVIEPAAWVLNLYKSRQVQVRGVNIIGWVSNSDGITIQSCENVQVSGCFVRSWDDSLVVKGYDGDVRGIHFKDCVLWTDLAQSCEVGYETRAAVMEDIRFENITVLHNFHKPAMSVHNSDHALVRDVLFRNITVEDAQMGEGDGARLLIELTTTKSQWSKTADRGRIRDVRFEGIRVLSGKDCSIRIFSFSRESNIDDIFFSDLEILGRRITSLEQMKMNVNNRNGDNIRLLNTPSDVSQNHPGYLKTYAKMQTAVAAETGIKASASSFIAPYQAENVVDGSLNSYWEGEGQGEDVLSLHFDAPREVEALVLYLNPAAAWGKREQTIAVALSRDGQAFQEVLPAAAYTFDPASGNQVRLVLQSSQVSAIRLTFSGNTASFGGQLAEIQVE